MKQEHYKINKRIFEDHNTQMFLQEIIADKEKIYLMINSQIKRNLKEGKFLTLRKINNRRVCDYESIAIDVKDSKGNKIPLVQYSINSDESCISKIKDFSGSPF
ncbi:hypothetical protein [Petroclostridium sp. X23]|uniref:hypothetical protein n=1 Tax=Petroclostridium sp. X23 TaxID=3045146 RepID=UPI0024AE0CBF|nr:hypothetical protein [Petroclostridium sp. X23]WHH60025.1 hypothetical protein QKW49_04565 [Petroclostridium sp. X23]